MLAAEPGQPATFAGDFYKIRDFVNWRQEPMPPPPFIWIAASGPAMLGAAGRVGDGVLLTKLMDLQFYRAKLQTTVLEGRVLSGSQAAIKVGAVRAVAVHEDIEVSRDRVRRAIVQAASREYHRQLLLEAGYSSELSGIADAVVAGDQAAAAAAVSDRMVDRLGIAATPEDVWGRLVATGLDLILVEPAMNGATGWAAARRATRELAAIIRAAARNQGRS